MIARGIRPAPALPPVAPSPSLVDQLARARTAQRAWAARPWRHRRAVLRRLRRRIAANATQLATSVGRADLATTLAAEVLPLLDAIAFCERTAGAVTASRRWGRRGRPAWVGGVDLSVAREPWGVVLVIGPGNYPCFLPAVQAVQALAVGNAVWCKPAPWVSAPLTLLQRWCVDAGLPAACFTILDDDLAAGQAAIAAGVDYVVFTGSSATGRAVHRACAAAGVPCTLECSGVDAVVVLPGADLELVARAVAYGLTLNDGRTCIAPRRVLVVGQPLDPLLARLRQWAVHATPTRLANGSRAALEAVVTRARRTGAAVVGGGETWDGAWRPTLVVERPDGPVCLDVDVAGPVLSLRPVADLEAAIAADAECPFALGAAVFGPERAARAVAARWNAGVVVCNDVIVPTADPRLPFGGRDASGFGSTRGREGLETLTRPKAVAVRTGRFRPHLAAPTAADAALFTQWIRFAHGSGARWRSALHLCLALWRRWRRGPESSEERA